MFPPKAYHAEIVKYQTYISSYARLKSGAHFCGSAARETITEALHAADDHDSGGFVTWMMISPLFLSTVVLALGILQEPHRRVARADLELLGLGTELLESKLSQWMSSSNNIENQDGQPRRANFANIGETLHSRVSSFYKLCSDAPRDASGASEIPALEYEQSQPTALHDPLSYDCEQTSANGRQDEGLLQRQAVIPQYPDMERASGDYHSTLMTAPPELAHDSMYGDQRAPHGITRISSQVAPFDGLDFHDIWDMIGSDLFLDEHSVSFA